MHTAARALRQRRLSLLVLLIALLAPSAASAAPAGTLDATWGGPTGTANAASACFDANTATLTEWCAGALAVQADGKIIVGGNTTKWNSSAGSAVRLFRLNADGTLDPSFPTVTFGGSAPFAQIWDVAVSSVGTIFVGGRFTTVTVDGVDSPRTSVVALNPDGTLKTSFDASSYIGAGANVYAVAPAPAADGGVIVGTDKCYANGTVCTLGHLNADGSQDLGFTGTTAATSSSGTVYAILPAPGGGYYIGGSFFKYKNVQANFITRISATGDRDATFAGNAGTFVTAVGVDADGKVLIGGDFTTYGVVNTNRFARLNTDGTLDTTFSTTSNWGPQVQPTAPSKTGLIWTIAADATGRIYVGGAFTSFKARGGDTLASGIVALNPDGTKDAAVTTALGTGASGWNTATSSWNGWYSGIRKIVPTRQGVYVAGTFDRFSTAGTQRNSVVRLASWVDDQQLTVVPAGTGTGTVTSDPAGIDCGTVCSGAFADGAVVTLTATPATGSSFTGWSGACDGTATTCTVTLSASATVTATFGPPGSTPSSPSAPTTASGTDAVSTSNGTATRSTPRLVSTTRSGSFDAVLRVRVPGAGTLRGVGMRTGAATGIACRIPAKQVARAGVVTLNCHLDEASRLLLRKGPLPVALATTYTATNGEPVVMRSRVTFRATTPAPSAVTG